MIEQWFMNVLENLYNALESIDWLFWPDSHPTLSRVENKILNYISAKIRNLQDRLNRRYEVTQIIRNESSVTERVVIVLQLEEMAGVVEHLDQMPIRLALDTLDVVIENCEEILTNLKQLKKWANQATKGVNIPF